MHANKSVQLLQSTHTFTRLGLHVARRVCRHVRRYIDKISTSKNLRRSHMERRSSPQKENTNGGNRAILHTSKSENEKTQSIEKSSVRSKTKEKSTHSSTHGRVSVGEHIPESRCSEDSVDLFQTFAASQTSKAILGSVHITRIPKRAFHNRSRRRIYFVKLRHKLKRRRARSGYTAFNDRI